MKNFIMCLVISFLFLQVTNAQSKLTGVVSDDNGEKIFFSTVALRNATDSTIVLANSSDENGYFELENIKDGKYYLEITMLGYTPYKSTTLDFPQDNNKNLSFTLQEDAQVLSTVEVTAKVPLLEQKADRLVVNVENNLTNIGGSILDVMKKVPGMLVIGNNLRMAGQSNLTILINGRTTKYMDIKSLMRDIPGDNIKKVEVIHQPGAEFDAEGTGPILNIILKKNSLFGTNGSIMLGVGKGVNWKGISSLSLSHYQGNVNINGSVGYRRSANYDEMKITRIVQDDVYDQTSVDPGFLTGLRSNVSVDWDISNRHRLGVSTQYYNTKIDNTIETDTRINFKSDTDINLFTDNDSDDHWKLLTINPYYTFEIDTNGQKINFDLNIVRINSDGTNTLNIYQPGTSTFFEDAQFIQTGNSKIFASQLDYTYPIISALNVQVGAKYSEANLDNDLIARQEVNTPGNWQENVGQSNHFLFDETIKAAYTKLNYSQGDWSGTLGLRFEESNSTGFSITTNTSLNRKISKLFPSFSIARTIAGPLGASFAYSYRIDRPSYSSLNPFVYNLDNFTSEEGNPNLRPSLTHSGKFNLTMEGQPFVNVEFKSSDDAMVEVTRQDDDTGETSLTTVNLNSFKVFNASLFFPLSFIPGVDGFGGFIANRNMYDSEYLDENFLRDVWDFTGFIQTEIGLPWEVKSQLTAWYNSGGQDGITKGDWLYGVDIGFGKSFLDEKLSVNLGVENLFNRFFYGTVQYSNMDIDIYNRWDGPVVNLQLNYKFGNRYMKRAKERDSSGSEEINRAQQ